MKRRGCNCSLFSAWLPGQFADSSSLFLSLSLRNACRYHLYHCEQVRRAGDFYGAAWWHCCGRLYANSPIARITSVADSPSGDSAHPDSFDAWSCSGSPSHHPLKQRMQRDFVNAIKLSLVICVFLHSEPQNNFHCFISCCSYSAGWHYADLGHFINHLPPWF